MHQQVLLNKTISEHRTLQNKTVSQNKVLQTKPVSENIQTRFTNQGNHNSFMFHNIKDIWVHKVLMYSQCTDVRCDKVSRVDRVLL